MITPYPTTSGTPAPRPATPAGGSANPSKPAAAWASEQERRAALLAINAFHARAMAIAVRATRVRTGDTIPAFARRCAVSTPTIRRWEANGYTGATFDAFRRIGVDILDVANAVSRGYAEAIGSPWYEIEDARRDRGSAA